MNILNEAGKKEEIIEELRNSLSFFHIDEQIPLIKELLDLWEGEKASIVFKIVYEDRDFPHVGVVAVAAPDWPGLSQSAIGTIHEKGWNLFRLNGYSLTYKNAKVGIIILGCLLYTSDAADE